MTLPLIRMQQTYPPPSLSCILLAEKLDAGSGAIISSMPRFIPAFILAPSPYMGKCSVCPGICGTISLKICAIELAWYNITVEVMAVKSTKHEDRPISRNRKKFHMPCAVPRSWAIGIGVCPLLPRQRCFCPTLVQLCLALLHSIKEPCPCATGPLSPSPRCVLVRGRGPLVPILDSLV